MYIYVMVFPLSHPSIHRQIEHRGKYCNVYTYILDILNGVKMAGKQLYM